MKKVIDRFSEQAAGYLLYRPLYPNDLILDILSYVENRQCFWDCATGNGQIASELARYFNEGYGTDISEEQLKYAIPRSNVIYKKERAEKTKFHHNQFDLVTVAQAVHWFDFKTFNKEVKRVLKPNGVLAIIGYDLLRSSPEINLLIDEFYYEVIGPYWDKQRQHIDHHYQTVTFNFDEIEYVKQRYITVNWTINELGGYFETWSSVQNYLKEKPRTKPVKELIQKIEPYWGNKEKKEFKFPIFMRIGKNKK
ncbi:class I SAM-dependent methyltransferase [Sediminitomix flava]|uniref:Methyltransferase family protein n=1 Tax=Sediminitomix flava TaxID=379075 RepID=A0A315Z9S1_SEDFL|nr:class I SAM-dependent methyltransferase [Sediminitomix flava]PWJ42325.1 methyltransferase family protein [Sediminitomix flava]